MYFGQKAYQRGKEVFGNMIWAINKNTQSIQYTAYRLVFDVKLIYCASKTKNNQKALTLHEIH